MPAPHPAVPSPKKVAKKSPKKKSKSKKKSAPLPAVVSSMQELATILKLSLATIKKLKKDFKNKGCPGTNQNGTYPVPAWAKWVKTLDLKDYNDEADGPKAEKIKLQNQLLRLQIAEREGDLGSVEEVIEVLAPFVMEVVNRVNGIPNEASAKTFGATSVGESKKIIGAAVAKALEPFTKIEATAPDQKKKTFWAKFSARWSELHPTLLLGSGAKSSSPTPTTTETTTPPTPSS
jgi:hypothetical protein